MPFPVSLHGTVPTGLDRPQAEKRLEWLLRKCRVSMKRHGDREIRIHVPLFRFRWAPDPFSILDNGTVRIEEEPTRVIIRYTVSTRRIATIVAALLLLILILPFLGHLNVFTATAIAVGGWFWVLGVSYVITWIWLPRYLKRRLAR
jgi:hypothetical protein